MPVLLSTAYFPPIEYFAAMARDFMLPPLQQSVISSCHLLPPGLDIENSSVRTLEPVPSVVYIEAHENYCKQSYRNRCQFYAASGPQNLMVPIIHENGTHRHPIMDIKVDYSTPWMQQHFKAIVSAYRTSAYFEYYQDELFAIMQACPKTLFELNLSIIHFFLDKIGISVDLRLTESYHKCPQTNISDDFNLFENGVLRSSMEITDLRDAIHPKHSNNILNDLGLSKPYFQVFADKHGFKSGLSIMDLLFNEGPDSIIYLKK